MAGNKAKWEAFRPLYTVVWSCVLASVLVSADRSLKMEPLSHNSLLDFLWQPNRKLNAYQHVWPDLKFNWKLVIGSIFGFIGGAFGSAGGVGGGGVFVPMLSLIIGFDPKSSAAISKCMIMGAAISTVYSNLKLRHPTLNMPIIDYDLAVLIQPMLLLGISIGVTLNVMLSDWMITILLIILFIATSTKAFFKGVETWKKETIMKKEAATILGTTEIKDEAEHKHLPGGPSNAIKIVNENVKELKVDLLDNVYWKELGLLVFVWLAFLALQILKTYTNTCSVLYWMVNILQIPVSFGVSGYQALCLYKGLRKISSKGNEGTNFKVHQLISYGLYGTLAGVVGGLLGVGGGSVMGPLFLELGIPPQVSSATATFAMMFSSSMSVVEYYFLKRFPVPYAVYLFAVATIAAFIGQHVVRRLIVLLGRASIIIFFLAVMIFISAISLGGVGISRMITTIQHHEYMGFDNLCMYGV